MIRLGYVGVNTLLPSASRTFRIVNYTEGKMLEVAKSNILALEDILRWNLTHKIFVFRITSHLIPYGSSTINTGAWKEKYAKDFFRIGEFIKNNAMQISMHPGQYTVLNTPIHSYYENALRDLEYHNNVLNLLGLDSSHKIVLHAGGGYGQKEASIKTLLGRIEDLSTDVKKRLVLENDDVTFNAEEILEICDKANLPAVFDIFHHQVLPSFNNRNLKEIILLFKKTWNDQRQEVHYSNQEIDRSRGAHSHTINVTQFQLIFQEISDLDLDIVLEVKDKQESVLKLRKKFPELR